MSSSKSCERPGAGEILHRQVTTPEWPRKRPFNPEILIMKGGGVKGLAYVGALEVLEEYGFKFNHFVGTSAGAITAALLAVGYSTAELRQILEQTNFAVFKDGWLPLSLIRLPFRKGLYKGEEFRRWIEELLRKKFPEFSDSVFIRFSHLNSSARPGKRLTIFASTKRRRFYAFDSQGPASDERISFACRCSMAIPYFFLPERISGETIVDGGMQNNYAVHALATTDPSLTRSKDFVGLYLGNKTVSKSRKFFLLDVLSIWSEAGDEEAKERFIDRTIVIDPRPIRTTDFSLSENERAFLITEGRASALRWLHHWGEQQRPTLEEVEQAETASAKLRASITNERWRRLSSRIALIMLIALLFSSAVFFILPTLSKNKGGLTRSPEETNADQQRPGLPSLKRPSFTVNSSTLRIICGTNDVTKSRAELEQTPLTFYSVAEAPAIKVHIERGTLYVDARVFTQRQSGPLELTKNNYSRLPVGWDLNSTETALEVVNEQMQPRLQVIYNSESEIQINGLFGNERQVFAVFGKKARPVYLTPSGPAFNPIKRLFKYPSSTYPGTYE
jgi:predicted acylesterase/phospholipase RssA